MYFNWGFIPRKVKCFFFLMEFHIRTVLFSYYIYLMIMHQYSLPYLLLHILEDIALCYKFKVLREIKNNAFRNVAKTCRIVLWKCCWLVYSSLFIQYEHNIYIYLCCMSNFYIYVWYYWIICEFGRMFSIFVKWPVNKCWQYS